MASIAPFTAFKDFTEILDIGDPKLSSDPRAIIDQLVGYTTPSPVMTMRYLKHAPEAYFDQDAERAAASISGSMDPETDARAELSRLSLKVIAG